VSAIDLPAAPERQVTRSPVAHAAQRSCWRGPWSRRAIPRGTAIDANDRTLLRRRSDEGASSVRATMDIPARRTIR